MAQPEDIKRVTDEFDPDRCAYLHPIKGQCINKCLPPSQYCLVHGGNKARQAEEKNKLRNYQLTKFSARAAQMSQGSSVKNLRDEIGILRMMLETKLNALESENDLIIQSSSVADLIMKINILVNSAHKLEIGLNEVLDKETLIIMAEQIVDVIAGKIKDEEILSQISNEIIDIIAPQQ